MSEPSSIPSVSGPTAGPAAVAFVDRTVSALPSAEQAQRTIQHFVRDDQICVLTFDRPGSAANIFDRRTLLELGEELDFVARTPKLRGLIVTSAKRSIFIAGADLNMMTDKASPDDVRELITLGQTVISRLAALTMPTVAAIHGACVGGGYELCLACDYRVASNDRATKIGLPETMLGLLPAWGGSTRLPRLIGLPKALDIILAGKTVAARQALKNGMVDNLAPVEYLVDVAVKMISGGKPRRKKHGFVNNSMAATVIASQARSRVLKKTRGHYPAITKALEVVTTGISKSIPESLALEREGIVELVQTAACHNLIRVFFLQERAKKQNLPGSALAALPAPITRAAVIGSGVMGGGITQWLSAKQLPVILKDINTDQLAKGMSAITRIYQDGVKRHALTSKEARDGMDRISPATTPVPLTRCDLVIEAAVENLDLKKKIFQSLDQQVGENAILATNTSALPIAELAATTRHPERVLGLHFFNPVHRMQLVEIVAGPRTSPEVLQRALHFTRQIGKLPVIVKDSPGFLVNRVLMPYLVEAGNLFESGAILTDLDEAMLDFGMPMGPMTLLDEVGIDVARHVAQTIATNYRDRMVVPDILGKMMQWGMLGKKAGRGFYLHRKGKSPRPNPRAISFVDKSARSSLSRPELQERMVLLMVNEAARCLEEQVVTDPADIDFAMIMGTGFAPFRGGPLRYADTVGIGNIVAAMDRLVAGGSSHFAPCSLLRSMAAIGRKFYSSAAESVQDATSVSSSEKPAPKMVAASQTLMPAAEPVSTKPSAATPAEEAKSDIDTSKMSDGQRAALELTEAAREVAQKPSLASGLFMGFYDLPRTFPLQSIEDREMGDGFLQKLEGVLRNKVDPDEIDRTGEIPEPVLDELARLGSFGIKIAKQYGGLGLSQTNYCRAAMTLGGYCGNITALLSAHQSIGVPQPLILFGTEEQKRKYLPRVAAGEISAFALTENGAGSDPATLQTHAEPTPDGKHFILNGEKLWCTNGTKAGVIVVMAKTPAKLVNGRSKDQITAFIVETSWPGVEVVHRCHFMGLKALYNGVMRFTNVRVPRENILLAEGKGLRVALTTLNTGRLTLPAACVGLSKRCVEIIRRWSADRVQWGAPIGKHAAIADKIARMAANTFAMESMTLLTASEVDRDKHADVRLEAAMCKMWGSEQSWEIVNDAVQIRGGRGYETADSLKARGEAPIALERFLRDCRINTIFEGSSEIMRLFIAREALDPHLKVSGAVLNSRLPISQRLSAAGKAAMFYAKWYPKQWLPTEWFNVRKSDVRPLTKHFRYVGKTSRKLARALFHAMAVNGPKLERQQILLGRFVEIGTELFAITATCLRAEQMIQAESSKAKKAELLHLVEYFCRASRIRVEEKFRGVHRNADSAGYKVAQEVMAIAKSVSVK